MTSQNSGNNPSIFQPTFLWLLLGWSWEQTVQINTGRCHFHRIGYGVSRCKLVWSFCSFRCGIITQGKDLNILSCGRAVIKSSKSLLASRNYLISCWQVKGTSAACRCHVRRTGLVQCVRNDSLSFVLFSRISSALCMSPYISLSPSSDHPSPSAFLFSALSSPNFLKEQYLSNNNRTENNSQKLYSIC